jgi:hypothetical protein
MYKQCILAELENLPMPYMEDLSTPRKQRLQVPSANGTPMAGENKKVTQTATH